MSESSNATFCGVASEFLVDIQHHLMILTLDGKLRIEPIEDMEGRLHNILDVATGTGNWAIAFGT